MTTPADLRERVIELAHSWRAGHYTKADRADLALAVAAMVAEECARECEKQWRYAHTGELTEVCAAAIRKRAEGLK